MEDWILTITVRGVKAEDKTGAELAGMLMIHPPAISDVEIIARKSAPQTAEAKPQPTFRSTKEGL
jgi:hypothetical protein